jgi:hypothetical protein
MKDRIDSLKRAVQYGLENGKKNVIVELDLLAAILNMTTRADDGPPGLLPAPACLETCGFCGGSGKVPGPTHDREGRQRRDWPERIVCEYCGGAGVCEEGSKLLPARPGVFHSTPAKERSKPP